MTDYSLLFSFPDQSESFVLGYEGGMIGAQIEAGRTTIECTVHTSNGELFRRMGAAYAYDVSLTPTGVPGWSELVMTARPKRAHMYVVSPAALGGSDGAAAPGREEG